MTNTEWYYADDGETVGPITQAELIERVRLGKLDAATLVWTDGMSNWVSLNDLELHREIVEPEASFQPPAPRPANMRSRAALMPSAPDPWRRFLARQLDFLIFQFAVVQFMGPPQMPAETWQLAVLFAVAYLCWAVVEAVFMCTLGSTPGKWLMRVRVTDLYGQTLRFFPSLRRSLDVTVRGQAVGVPPITVFAMLFGLYRLLGKGITPWDLSGKFVVTHGRLELWRWLLMVGLSLWLLRGGSNLA